MHHYILIIASMFGLPRKFKHRLRTAAARCRCSRTPPTRFVAREHRTDSIRCSAAQSPVITNFAQSGVLLKPRSA